MEIVTVKGEMDLEMDLYPVSAAKQILDEKYLF